MSFFLGLSVLLTPLSATSFRIFTPPPELEAEVQRNETALGANPKSADAHFDLAMSYAYTGRVLEGWDVLKKIPDLDPGYAQKVVDKYSKLSQDDPKEWKYPFKLAFGYYFMDKKEKARDSFQEVIHRDPKSIWGRGFLAYMYVELGEFGKAVEACDQALAIDQRATGVYFVKAWALSKKGDIPGALDSIMKYRRYRSYERALRPVKTSVDYK